MPTPRQYQPAQFLKNQGYTKSGDKYINPLTGRKITKASALNKASQVLGFKDFDQYKGAYLGHGRDGVSAFDRFKGYAEAKHLPTHLGSKFMQLYKAAYQTNPPFKARSKQLKDLLTYVGKRNSRTQHQAGETPRKRRKR